MTQLEQSPASTEAPAAAVELRSANVAGVNFAQRLIEVIAVPWEQEAAVEYRGEMWLERFIRGAFDGVEKRAGRVRVNRDHDGRRTVGKVASFYPSRDEGLVASVRIANTPLGDETLALADEDCLGASVGFAVRGSDQDLDRQTRKRAIRRAFMDHLSFVPDPAYEGAGVLSVRTATPQASDLQPLVTPELDEVRAWFDQFRAARNLK
jgi:HK97 family phage prohead protease